MPIACGFSGLFGWPSAFVKAFALTSVPVIANEFMWGLGTTMYSLAYGRMGDEAVAAITIATTIQDIVVVLSLIHIFSCIYSFHPLRNHQSSASSSHRSYSSSSCQAISSFSLFSSISLSTSV